MTDSEEPSTAYAGVVGTWDVKISTPIGTIDTEYVFVATGDVIGGEARSRQEVVPLADLAVEVVGGGLEVGWNQRITKPMRLNLSFAVQVVGDQMSGTSKAGPLPKSAVRGTRRGT